MFFYDYRIICIKAYHVYKNIFAVHCKSTNATPPVIPQNTVKSVSFFQGLSLLIYSEQCWSNALNGYGFGKNYRRFARGPLAVPPYSPSFGRREAVAIPRRPRLSLSRILRHSRLAPALLFSLNLKRNISAVRRNVCDPIFNGMENGGSSRVSPAPPGVNPRGERFRRTVGNVS